jgi:diguanylate cyclase (GGDEF)-like protein
VKGELSQAETEIKAIDLGTIGTDYERYRVLMFQGYLSRMLGKDEVALAETEQGLNLATRMHDDLRILCAMIAVGRVYGDSGNFERASAEADAARALATRLGEEGALADIWEFTSDIAERRGDRAADLRGSLEALEHARRSGSRKWLSIALVGLSDTYRESGDYAEALKYAKEGLPIMVARNDLPDVRTTLFDEGLAYIGLGKVKAGRRLADAAIAQTLAGGNLLDARDLLGEYGKTLERTGYLMMAIDVYRRYTEVGRKVMTYQRQRAFLELSARFDDQRRAAELELLRRDNAIEASEVRRQRLRQQFVLAAVLFVAGICAALLWAFTRVRKANERLRFQSEHDPLTGLSNRRYFNDRVLTTNAERSFSGCVVLADLDHFKRINDTYGHPAGDAVLASISLRLSGALRETDTLVRWGGEEFLAILEPMTAVEAASTIERLMRAVRREPVVWNDHHIPCTVSIGYATFPQEGSNAEVSLESAIKLVDEALYEAKLRGRDRACFASAARDDNETAQAESAASRARFVEIRGDAA